MSPRRVDEEDPDRLYTLTGGRTTAGHRLDLVALVVGALEPVTGMQSEQARILRLCAATPVSVVELSAELRLPVTVVLILLGDLLDAGHITVRHPARTDPRDRPSPELLKEVLRGLQTL
jgi:hypothetical protein